MKYTYEKVEGKLYKKIDSKKFYHANDYHKKFYSLNFSTIPSKLEVTEGDGSGKPYTIELNTISGCYIIEEESTKKRSSSLLGRIMSFDSSCPWEYGFYLNCKEREYTLYASHKEDREHWVQIF